MSEAIIGTLAQNRCSAPNGVRAGTTEQNSRRADSVYLYSLGLGYGQ